MLDRPFYRVYRSEESEVPWFVEKPGVLLEHTDYFTDGVSHLDTMTILLRSLHDLCKLDRPHQLFPFDPAGRLDKAVYRNRRHRDEQPDASLDPRASLQASLL